MPGGHISPILVASKARDIRVIDVRHEVNAVFAADAVARLTGSSVLTRFAFIYSINAGGFTIGNSSPILLHVNHTELCALLERLASRLLAACCSAPCRHSPSVALLCIFFSHSI